MGSRLIDAAIEMEVLERVRKIMEGNQQVYRIRVFIGDWDDTPDEDPMLWKGYLNHIPQVGDIFHIGDERDVEVIRRQVFHDSPLEIDLFTQEVE